MQRVLEPVSVPQAWTHLRKYTIQFPSPLTCKMVEYCESTTVCRHKALCEYFGDTTGNETQKVGGVNTFCDYACDVCRDPEGTRQLKILKLTPVGSQDQFYPREEIERTLEVFDTSFDPAPVSVHSSDPEESMVIDADEVATVQIPRPVAAIPVKKPLTKQRDETTNEILEILNPLNAQSPPPDLLPRAAKRIESKIFKKVSQQRSVNALGRSSTLVTAAKSSNLVGKYIVEKDKVLQKVRQYVETATSEDVDLEKIQQGEVWDVFREVLDNKDLE